MNYKKSLMGYGTGLKIVLYLAILIVVAIIVWNLRSVITSYLNKIF
jgi:hypothetical protein